MLNVSLVNRFHRCKIRCQKYFRVKVRLIWRKTSRNLRIISLLLHFWAHFWFQLPRYHSPYTSIPQNPEVTVCVSPHAFHCSTLEAGDPQRKESNITQTNIAKGLTGVHVTQLLPLQVNAFINKLHSKSNWLNMSDQLFFFKGPSTSGFCGTEMHGECLKKKDKWNLYICSDIARK